MDWIASVTPQIYIVGCGFLFGFGFAIGHVIGTAAVGAFLAPRR
jgi:high-affinity nickel permease